MLHGSCRAEPSVTRSTVASVRPVIVTARCAAAHGAAFGTYSRVKHEAFHVVSGAAHTRHSPRRITRTFCDTRIDAAVHQRIATGVSRAGHARRHPGARPVDHIFVRSKAPWYEITDDLPQHLTAGDVAEIADTERRPSPAAPRSRSDRTQCRAAACSTDTCAMSAKVRRLRPFRQLVVVVIVQRVRLTSCRRRDRSRVAHPSRRRLASLPRRRWAENGSSAAVAADASSGRRVTRSRSRGSRTHPRTVHNLPPHPR